jgi:Holliday junction resolvase RusA-like endonuclease
MIHSFTIQCNPPKSTHQGSMRIMKRKDGSQFVGKFASSKGKAAQNDLMSMLTPHRPEKPFLDPVTCEIQWVYPYRKTEKKRNIGKLIPCDTRPDCDNLAKMIFDSMTRLGFWNDDSQVYRLTFSKFWGEQAGISVKIVSEEL